MKLYLSDVFVVPTKSNIKSATGNNGNYSQDDENVYHQLHIPKAKLRISSTPEGFVSDKDIERYNQRTYHATGHIVKDNKLNLAYAFTGGGWHSRGYGIYSSELKSSAAPYRTNGLKKDDRYTNIYEFTLKGGRKVRNAPDVLSWTNGSQTWRRNSPEGKLWAFLYGQLEYLDRTDDAPSALRDALDEYTGRLEHRIENSKRILEELEDKPENIHNIIRRNSAEKLIREAQADLDFARENAPVYAEYIKPKRGNIYAVESPEKFQILDWDKDIHEKSRQVQNILRSVIRNFDRLHITGGELYRALAKKLGSEKKASMWLMQQGIPGLMYLDKASRDNGGNTHNFVTWDTRLTHLLGVEGDIEAVEYFRDYRAEHPDGFLVPEAIEKLNQLVTHATGNIILGNRFDLKYVGTSEGGDMFGYGAYFEQSPEVAKSYRRYGLKNFGFDKIDVKLSNGTVLSLTEIFKQLDDLRYNPDTKIKLPAKVSNVELANAIKELIYANIEASKTDTTSWDFSKAIQKLIHDIERDAHQALNDGRVNFSKELRETARALRAIKSMEFFGEKRGNIYQFDIPEDYELLDWDKKLNEQPEQIMFAIRELTDEISNNPAKFLAMGLARRFKSQEAMQTKLATIISALYDKAKGLFDKSRRYRPDEIIDLFNTLPEYKQLVRIVHTQARRVALQIYDSKPISMRNTGGELNNKLTDLMYFGDVRDGTHQEESSAAKIAASMYLNSKGIPGHRFLDRGSRSSGKGTHNFVIWNMGRVRMVGIDPDSDQEAIDYYNRTKKLKDLLAQADTDNIDFGNLSQGNSGFISDETVERYHKPSLHGTGHTLEENRMKLSKVGSGEGGQYRGWGVYSAQARGVAETYRRFGLPEYPTGRKTFSLTFKDGSIVDFNNLLMFGPVHKEIREIYRGLIPFFGMQILSLTVRAFLMT